MKKNNSILELILCVLLTIVCLLSASINSFAYNSKTAKPFDDVPNDKWYSAHVQFVDDNGIMMGTSEFSFSPLANMTRAMSVQILYKIAGLPNVCNDYSPFVDVLKDKWYSNAVLWAYENGITAGKGEGKFDPNANVTRAEFATFLLKYAAKSEIKYKNIKDNTIFNDDNNIPSYAKLAVKLAQQSCVVSGKPGNIFAPEAYITRAEAATMIHMFMINTEKQEQVLLGKYNLKASVVSYFDQSFGVAHFKERGGFAVILTNDSSNISENSEIYVYAKVISKSDVVEAALEKRDNSSLVFVFPQKGNDEIGYLDKLNLQKNETFIAEITITIGEENETIVFYPTVEVVS